MSTQNAEIDKIAGQVLGIVRDSLPKAYNALSNDAGKRTTSQMPTAEAVLSQAAANFVAGRVPHHTGIVTDESVQSMAEGIRGYLDKMNITQNAASLAHLKSKRYGNSVHQGVGRVMQDITNDGAWRTVVEAGINPALKKALGTNANLDVIQIALNEIVADLPEKKRLGYLDKGLNKIAQDVSSKFAEMKQIIGNDMGQAI
ncbi:MAG: hypothetical protein ACN2B6_03085 [Rickettsiales bacterium]